LTAHGTNCIFCPWTKSEILQVINALYELFEFPNKYSSDHILLCADLQLGGTINQQEQEQEQRPQPPPPPSVDLGHFPSLIGAGGGVTTKKRDERR
jgi:hypothetical protein